MNMPFWKMDFIECTFLSPDHDIICNIFHGYEIIPFSNQFVLDMGDAPQGSYLSLKFGYMDTGMNENVTHTISIPVYIRPMIPPKVSGDFGPFNQAIAPGVMQHDNTFIITTEVYSDLNKVTGRFYDISGKEIAHTEAVPINDTLWHLTYNMAAFSPPETSMRIEYYLGTNPHPVLIEGPFTISIFKTRPKWFDFIPDTSFHDISQSGNSVTFSVSTPLVVESLGGVDPFNIPSGVPILGGTGWKMEAPTTMAYLKYAISEYKLELNEPPEFSQKILQSPWGSCILVEFDYSQSQHSSYFIDAENNLHAIQNNSYSGSFSKELGKVEKKIKMLIKHIDEETEKITFTTIIIRPTFTISLSCGFGYASRINMIVDEVSGGWGSAGCLDIDADPDHTQAYNASASYHFYTGILQTEFSVGVVLASGLVSAFFGIQFRLLDGVGKSYITIPKDDEKKLKSGVFQIYGRVYLQAFWGWYEQSVWGPELFLSWNFWGDDMSHCFPPDGKDSFGAKQIAANTSWPELIKGFKPVSNMSKIPLPFPEPSIATSDYYKLFTWTEMGKAYGERRLHARYLEKDNQKFSDKLTIEVNNNAINNHIADAISEDEILLAWSQSRHTNKSILNVKPENVITEFAQSQDIWFAVYDLISDSLIQMQMIEDDTRSITSGKAEGNPQIVVLSNSRAFIIWQVADLETDQDDSDIYYVLLQKQGDMWEASSPAILIDTEGIKTDLKIAKTEEGRAVAVWLNTISDDPYQNCIMTAWFDGSTWSYPVPLYDPAEDHYINYLDMKFNNGAGAVIWTTFVEDTTNKSHENLNMIPWDTYNNCWSTEAPYTLLTDSSRHIQLPQMAIYHDGSACVAAKIEVQGIKNEDERICQIDILNGDLYNPGSDWNHIVANQYVCDTSKQVAAIQLTYTAKDTLMILTNEYPMLATNSSFEPVNGVIFGDSYMNLVLRSFALDDNGEVNDVDENNYFVNINEQQDYTSKIRLYQNYPNPCKDFTTIRFDIPDGSHILLELFDMTGFRTAVLVDQKLMAGQYEIILNTAVLKPGTYIYKLTTDDSISTLRMIVNR